MSRARPIVQLRSLLLALTAIAVPVLAEVPAVLVVSAAHLLDVRSGKLIDNPVVVIRDGRVSTVARAGDDTAVPADARRLDLAGMTLLPGLIDMHVHLDSDPEYGGYTELQFGDRFWSALMVPNAAATLAAGFTTVRNVGSRDWNDVGLRQAIDAGKVPGPRMITAGWGFGATGGHCDSNAFPASMNQANPFNADSPDEGRKNVRTLRKYGAQVIKICATGGVFSHHTEPGQQQLSLEEMQAIVSEAHLQGLRVAAHAHGASGIRDAVRAGIDTIEHASLIDDEGIKMAKASGTWLAMDIYNTEYTQSEGKKNGLLEDNLRKDREIGDVQRQNFRKAFTAGVKMVFGTDAGVYPHGDNARQFRYMVQYGMTPLDAIRAATVNAAEALGRNDVGVLEPGRFADMVAVGGDPLQDVTLLENIAVVLKGGDVVKDTRSPE